MKKAFIIIIIMLLAFIAINIVRDQDSNFPLPQVLPFCSGEDVNMFDLGAILMIVMALMGISNLNRKDKDD